MTIASHWIYRNSVSTVDRLNFCKFSDNECPNINMSLKCRTAIRSWRPLLEGELLKPELLDAFGRRTHALFARDRYDDRVGTLQRIE